MVDPIRGLAERRRDLGAIGVRRSLLGCMWELEKASESRIRTVRMRTEGIEAVRTRILLTNWSRDRLD